MSNLLIDNKELMKEFDYEKNANVDISHLTLGSKNEVWWLCKKGHNYKRSIYYKYRKHKCPICTKEKVTSFQEKIVCFYIKKYYKDAIENYKNKNLGKREIDIYIPSIKVGIEYDGGYYHKNIKNDIEKDKICNKLGIKLYRIRDHRCEKLNSTSVCYYRKDKTIEDLEIIIYEILKELGVKNHTITIMKDLSDIYSEIEFEEKNRSLASMNSKLSKEWNYEKNGLLTPNDVYPSSSKKVWWKCEKGHEWVGTINGRSKGASCPICLNQVVQAGVNDLLSTNPELSKEWDFQKNGKIKPSEICEGSGKKVWWKCKKGHSYQMSIINRKRGFGCPYCSNHKVLKGYNDLLTLNPKLSKEWNYEKNKPLTPQNVTQGSAKKVWWKCKKGHEWEAVVYTRTSGSGCPYCNSNAIKINQYTKEGIFVQQYNSCTDAGKSIGISGSGIKYACENKSLTKGYQWRFDQNNKTNIGEYKNNNKCIRRVKQYDLDGNYIKTFDGVRKAMDETGAKKVSEVCSGKRKSSGGYIWKYE